MTGSYWICFRIGWLHLGRAVLLLLPPLWKLPSSAAAGATLQPFLPQYNLAHWVPEYSTVFYHILPELYITTHCVRDILGPWAYDYMTIYDLLLHRGVHLAMVAHKTYVHPMFSARSPPNPSASLHLGHQHNQRCENEDQKLTTSKHWWILRILITEFAKSLRSAIATASFQHAKQ